MEILSVRDYRNNLSSSFDRAAEGERVLIRRRNSIFALINVGDEELSLTPSQQRRIEEMARSIKCSFEQVKQIEAGVLPAKSAKTLLNELWSNCHSWVWTTGQSSCKKTQILQEWFGNFYRITWKQPFSRRRTYSWVTKDTHGNFIKIARQVWRRKGNYLHCCGGCRVGKSISNECIWQIWLLYRRVVCFEEKDYRTRISAFRRVSS